MSYSAILRIATNGDVSDFATAHNSWGFAPSIWDHFSLLHFGKVTAMFDGGRSLQRVWKLFGTPQLDLLDNLVLGSTFDRVWIKRDRLLLLADGLDRFVQNYIRPQMMVETSAEIAAALRRLHAEEPHVLGAAIDATSTIDSWWRRTLNEEDDPETRPFNILRDKLTSSGKPHWEIGEP